jgi:glycosyltransferase involved in cell wall biosynthesis
LLGLVDFYRNGIHAFERLGFEVVAATKLSEIPRRADLYFTWWWGSGALALLRSLPARRPNIFTGTLQLENDIGWWEGLGAGRRAVVRSCFHLADANVAIAGVELEALARLGAPRRHLLHQGIDTATYAPPETARRECRLLTISHLTRSNVHRKRVATALKAMPLVLARFPEARLEVIGGHEDAYEDLTALAASLGISHAVEFPGRVSTAEKVAAYHRASVYLQPTLYEGFGVSIAEAMATGLPVITSARGAVPEVVGDCGRFVEPDDAEGLARDAVWLLSNADDAAQLGARGRERIVRGFSFEQHCAGLATIVSSVLPGWRPPTRPTGGAVLAAQAV